MKGRVDFFAPGKEGVGCQWGRDAPLVRRGADRHTAPRSMRRAGGRSGASCRREGTGRRARSGEGGGGGGWGPGVVGWSAPWRSPWVCPAASLPQAPRPPTTSHRRRRRRQGPSRAGGRRRAGKGQGWRRGRTAGGVCPCAGEARAAAARRRGAGPAHAGARRSSGMVGRLHDQAAAQLRAKAAASAGWFGAGIDGCELLVCC